MEKLRIALLQILPESTLEKNLKKGLDYCRKAKDQGADIALFPEMWSTGCDMLKNVNEPKCSAIIILKSPFAFLRNKNYGIRKVFRNFAISSPQDIIMPVGGEHT